MNRLAISVSIVVAVLLFFAFSATVTVPGWVLAILGVVLIPMVIDASRKQKRMERAMFRSLRRTVTRR